MNHDSRETAFYDALGCLVIRLDRQLNIWFMNRFALNLLGYERLGQVFGKPLHAVLPDGETNSAELLTTIRNLEQAGSPNCVESDLLHSDGSRIPVSWNLSVQNSSSHHVAPTVLIGFDASRIRQSQAAAVMFQTVSDHYTGSIMITDARQSILYANPALLRSTGYSLGEVLGKTPTLFKSGLTADEVYRSLWETLDAGNIWVGEFVNRRKDGGQYLEIKSIAAILDALGKVEYYFAIGEDISQRQQYQQRIDSLLTFDQLTGLPNRTTFLRSLVRVLDNARQEAKEATVLHVDIDDFFVVNDAVGSNDADLVIAEIAMRLKEALRQADQLARLGNDKFAILLGPHEAGIDDDIGDVVARVQMAIGKPSSKPGSQSASRLRSVSPAIPMMAAMPANCSATP